jgi:hypothetical protein
LLEAVLGFSSLRDIISKLHDILIHRDKATSSWLSIISVAEAKSINGNDVPEWFYDIYTMIKLSAPV